MNGKFDEMAKGLGSGKRVEAFRVCNVGIALASLPISHLAQAGGALDDPASVLRSTNDSNAATPWSQIGAKAGADYKGDGPTVIPTAEGARLRCVFQRLEGEATREGLWLTSTVTNTVNDHFRVVATAAGRVTVSTAGNSLTEA